jgi:hypothetical protein
VQRRGISPNETKVVNRRPHSCSYQHRCSSDFQDPQTVATQPPEHALTSFATCIPARANNRKSQRSKHPVLSTASFT